MSRRELRRRRGGAAALAASVAAVIACAVAAPAAEARRWAPDPLAEIVATLEREVAERRVPGASIAIVIGDSVALLHAIGVRSVETGERFTPGTLVRIGSVTKMVTGLTALLSERDGRLSLDAPIGRVDPALRAPLRPLTMRQLLTHTAGLTNEAAGDGPHDESALAGRVRGWGAERIFTSAGDIFSYSSPGYWLAGHIVARADGGSYVESVSRRVLEPLGMRRSTFRPTDALTWPLALDHRRGPEGAPIVVRPFPDDATTWPSGSLFSSADELARLAIALLNEGRLEGRQALPADVVRRMLVPEAPTPGGGCGYSYGLTVCGDSVGGTARHYGFRGGSGAVFTLVPSRRIAVVVLANGPGAILTATESAALERLAGPLPEDAAAPTARPPIVTLLGRWANGPDTLRISQRGDSLRYRYGEEESPLAIAPDGSLLVGPPDAPTQGFLVVRGRRTGRWYLHDGLSAFARVGR